MDKIDALINEIQGNNTDGVYRYNGLTYDEWLQEGRDYVIKHGSKKGWKNNKFIRQDGEEIELYSTKRTNTPQSVLDKAEHMRPRKTSISKNFQQNRQEREKVPEKLRSEFSSDAEFQKFKDYVKRGVESNIELTRAQSVGGREFDHGHLKALGAGGSNDPADQRLESRASNRSTQQNFDPTDEQLRATGHATNWDEAVKYYKEGRPENYFRLTPQDKQRIWRGEDPDVVIGQRNTAIDQNPLAKPAPQRFDRLAEFQGKPLWQQLAAAAMGRIPLSGIAKGAIGGAFLGAKPGRADITTLAKATSGDFEGVKDDVLSGSIWGGAIGGLVQVAGKVGLQRAAMAALGKTPPAIVGQGIAGVTFQNPEVVEKYAAADNPIDRLKAIPQAFIPDYTEEEGKQMEKENEKRLSTPSASTMMSGTASPRSTRPTSWQEAMFDGEATEKDEKTP